MTMKKLNDFAIKMYLAAQDEEGIGTIELVLIVVVLIALVIIFKDGLTSALKNFLAQIEGKASELF